MNHPSLKVLPLVKADYSSKKVKKMASSDAILYPIASNVISTLASWSI